MTRITLAPDADPEAALTVIRETLTSREYLWEPQGPLRAVAHEGGKPITSTTSSRRLRVTAEVDPAKARVVLKQDTTGAAYAGAGIPVFTVRLNFRFAKLARAVRDDLTAAGQR